MLSVLYRPGLVTPGLLAWVRPFVHYDADGRGSCWLVQGQPLPPALWGVAGAVAPGVDFPGVLLQCYRDGRASTPCHTDAGGTGFSFTLSLGAARTFRVHRVPAGSVGCGDYDLDVVAVECVEGTVLLMDEAFQAGWHHQIVADPGVTGEKLSLVFRTRPGAG